MTQVYLNGKFTAQAVTGVQRVAASLVEALDAELADPAAAPRWVLLCPVGAVAPPLRRIQVRHVGLGGLPLHLWEQLVLPVAAASGFLVNLAGAAPWFARRQVCLIHDAAVFDAPSGYTRVFLAWYRLLFRHLARGAAARLLTVSVFSRGRLAHHLNLPEADIDVVGNGGDHLDTVIACDAVLRRHGLVGRRFILAVGSANPSKNIASLVAAYRLLGDPGSHRLVIVGESNERVFAGKAGVDPAGVIRVGRVDDTGLKALFGAAAGLVFPSRYEGFGLPPLEAMACGCPVAVARAASLPEVCGEAALYFDPAVPTEIVEVMRRLLDDRGLGEELRQLGRRRVASLRWKDAARRLRRAVEAVAASPAAGCRA